MLNKSIRKVVLSLVITLLVCVPLFSDKSSTIEQDIKRYTLQNGATLLLLPRANAPIINCVSFVNVGSVREREGITGISHFLEHLAFKGTENIGTTDYSSEQEWLQRCEVLFDEIRLERSKGSDADESKLEKLNKELQSAMANANEYVVDDEFSRFFEMNGGEGLNAATSYEMTIYMVNLPSNKLELWMLMEADRFTNPVFRQLYQEREVILEEKRMTESSPYTRLSQKFLENAFQEHPYRNPIIGTEEDIKSISNKEVRDYFEEHYGAENLVFVIVGDIEPDNVLELANRHLINIPKGEKNRPLSVVEPKQTEERRFVVEDSAQPYMMIGYKVPPGTHKDSKVYNVIADILGQGRTSRLYKVLVEEKKMAVSAFSYVGYPGRVFENLFVIGVIPAEGVSLEDCLVEVENQVELLKEEMVTDEELSGVKKRSIKSSINRVKSGSGLAFQLAYYESLFDDYSLLFKELEEIEQINKADLMRVMQKTFVPENRTIGELKPKGGR
ncbi:MAG: pitrilysin family protein [Candidatus Cloacimonadia bacterium]